METLKLCWLGSPLVELKGRAVKLETRKATALLAYLSLQPGECQRERLATMFWPEANQQKALANLRRTLSSLNSSLRKWIKADRETITVKHHDKLWVDVKAFHQLRSQLKDHSHPEKDVCADCLSILDKAVELYRGDFLEGLNLSDAPIFDEWQFFQRDSLRQEFADVLKRISNGYSERGQWEQAILCARRWSALDRLHEPACRRLMDLYARSGQQTVALRQYEELSRLLKEQLGQEPEAETRRLYEYIRGRDQPKQVVQSLEHPTSFPLLKTKLYIPAAPASRVIRTQLIDCLGAVEQKALTIISAPAGFGKTTLLAEWIAQTSLPVAWLALDNGDNDPYRFLSYLIAALEGVQEDVGAEAKQLILLPQQVPGHIILASLINDLGRVAEPYVLVLDDYQFMTEHAVHETMAYLLDHLPSNMHLVIATRADPPLQLGRLRANGQMLELRTQELRFTSDEAIEFLNEVMRLGLSLEDIGTLQARTEGWAVGLQMAALALQERADTAEFIQKFSGRERFVIDYLFEEVVSRQPDYIQTFLIQTSILERMTGPLCDAVLGKKETADSSSSLSQVSHMESGQQILEYLERANLFLVSLDDERCYFRYHHLFSDLLRHRLYRNSPDLVPGLHSRAAEWFEMQGNTADTLDHWIAAKNFTKAAQVIASSRFSLLAQGNFRQMLTWLQQIPEDVVYSQPWLCILYSWEMIFTGRFSEGEEYLSFVEKMLPPLSEAMDRDFLEQHGHIATLREYLASRSQDVAGIIGYADLALKYLAPDDSSTRSIVAYFLGHGRLLSNQLALAQAAYTEAANLGKEANNILITVNALCALANILQSQGELHRSLNIYQQAASRALDERDRLLPVSAEADVGRARLYYEWNDLTAAEKDLLAAYELFKFYPNFDLRVDYNIALSRLRLAQGDTDAADRLIQEVAQSDRQPSLRQGIALLASQINLYQTRGELDSVTRLIDHQDWSLESKSLFVWAVAFIAYAKFLVAQHKVSRAHNLLKECLIKLETCGLRMHAIQVLIIQASLLDSQGKQSLAQAKMERAVSLAEPEGFIRIFVDEGEKVRCLLTRCRSHITSKTGIDKDSSFRLASYIDKLLDSFGGL